MTGWLVLAFPQAVPPTLVSPRTLGEGDWLDHSVEFWVEMELWKLSFCCKVIGRWNETLWMQLLQARKMMVNGSSWNQNHYKYVQLDVLFNPNKYVLQDFARSFVRTSESESWEFFQQTENFIPLQRYLTNLDLQTIGSLHVYASCKFFAYWPSIYTFINENVILFFRCFCQSN